MSAAYLHTVCARVREQVSLELDGELSQLEHRMLATHLERCARCAAYAADVRDVTARIRNAPYAVMQRPIVVRRRRAVTTMRLPPILLYVFRRLAIGLVVLFGISAVAFSMAYLLPSDPVTGRYPDITNEQRAEMRRQMGSVGAAACQGEHCPCQRACTSHRASSFGTLTPSTGATSYDASVTADLPRSQVTIRHTDRCT